MRFGWLAIGAMVAATTAVAQGPAPAAAPNQTAALNQPAAPKQIKVQLLTSTGQSAGFATFKTVKKGVKVKLDLKNLPFGDHAVHIHQNPVCDAPDFEGAGGHFNPDGKRHGYLNPMGHHNGDFPSSVSIGEDHTGEAAFVLRSISLDPSAPDSLFLNGGTSIVVHARADDEKTNPSGDSGNRIACGVIKR